VPATRCRSATALGDRPSGVERSWRPTATGMRFAICDDGWTRPPVRAGRRSCPSGCGGSHSRCTRAGRARKRGPRPRPLHRDKRGALGAVPLHALARVGIRRILARLAADLHIVGLDDAAELRLAVFAISHAETHAPSAQAIDWGDPERPRRAGRSRSPLSEWSCIQKPVSPSAQRQLGRVKMGSWSWP